MKISKIVIDNLYGIKHVELDGSPVELRGKKERVKTSVIDAIKLALTNRSSRDYIVRDGEREGEIPHKNRLWHRHKPQKAHGQRRL